MPGIFKTQYRNFLGLVEQNSSVSNVALVKVLHGLLNALFVHLVVLSDGLDLVVSGELQHSLVDVAGSDDGTLDGKTLGEQTHVRDGEVTLGNGEGEDGTAGGHDGEVEVPVGLSGGGDEQAVDGLDVLELLDTLGGVELAGTESLGLVLLGVGTGEDDNVTTHLGSELDGQVTETTNTDNTDAVGGLGVVHVESVEDGGTTALERGSSLIGKAVGGLEKEGLAPDTVGSERTLVGIGVTVHLSLSAVGLSTLQALLAVGARVVLVTPANAVSLLQESAGRAKLLNDTDTLVTESHIGLAVVHVGTAETGSSNSDVDLVASKGGLGVGSLLDGTGLGALVDSV
jgi:hypothetical protein